MEERIFWNDVSDAFARSAADPADSARQNAEIQIWESISNQDFKEETW